MSTQARGVYSVNSDWSSGSLVFYEKAVGRTATGDVLTIGTTAVNVGGTSQAVDFGWYASGSLSFVLSASGSSMTLVGCNVAIDGDVEIGSDDIALDQGYFVYFDGLTGGESIRSDTEHYLAIKGTTGVDIQIGATDEINITATAVTLPTNNLTLTAGEISVAATHYVYLDGQGGGDYVRCATDNNVIVNGATTSALGVAGTAVITAAAASATFAQKIIQDDTTNSTAITNGSIQTDGGLGVQLDSYLGGDVYIAATKKLDFGAGDVTMTHSTDKLTVASTWTAAAVGRPFGVNLTLNVTGGNYVNALKGYVECGTGGGTIGLLSAVNCEIKMPNAACAGAFYPLEVEWVGQASTAFGLPGTGSQSGFIYMAASGTVTDFDSDGVLMAINGLTTGSTKLFSTGTLRISIADTLYYLPLSTVNATFTTAYPIATTSTITSTCTTAGISCTASTLNASTGRIGYFKGTVAAPNQGDGYGVMEIEADFSGTIGGTVAASSTWINFASAAVPGGNMICVQNNGIWLPTGITTSSAKMIMGMRMQYVDTDGNQPAGLFCFSTNISANVLTAMFDVNTIEDLGGSTTAASGNDYKIPLFKTANDGQVWYANVYHS